ncbi:hypothetical protein LCGC14_2214610 [marine sediment metagenome]|uniref:Uncharacterized protein n=1 Tax=marine sediment metagenome TaxID=412755 RepID=A0A0F9DCQ3_9ZZZZ
MKFQQKIIIINKKMTITSVQIDKNLMEKVKEIMKKKKPLRKINSYAEATREVLIDFVNKNQRFLSKNLPKNPENQLEAATEGS